MKNSLNILEKILKILLLIFGGAMITDVILQIIARKMLSISIPWTEELARYLMIWIGFIGLGVAYRLKELHFINILTEKLSLKNARLLSFLSDILIALFLIPVIIYGIKICRMNMSAVTAALRMPTGIVMSAIPVGCALTLLFTFESIWGYLRRGRGN